MDTAVMPRRSKTFVKSNPSKVLDAYYISLTQQILSGLKPSLCFDKVEAALASGSVSEAVIDDLEDAMFGTIMIEGCGDDDEFVSEEEVMEFLRQR